MFNKTKIMVFKITVLIGLFCNIYASDQLLSKGEKDSVKNIAYKCSEIDRIIKNAKIQPVILCYVIQSPEKTGIWVKSKECKNNLDYYKKASVYLSKNKVIKICTESDSSSGDWTNRRTYYFAGKNTLIFEYVEHVTFNAYDFENDKLMDEGPYTIKEKKYYNADWEIVSSEVEAINRDKKQVQAKYIQKPDMTDMEEIDNMISSL